MSKGDLRIKKIKKKMEYYNKCKGNKGEPNFTKEEAIIIADKIGIDFINEKFSLDEFVVGINVELEHGSKFSETNITKNHPILTGKIAYAHLKEFPDYYERLKKLENEAEEYWSKK